MRWKEKKSQQTHRYFYSVSHGDHFCQWQVSVHIHSLPTLNPEPQLLNSGIFLLVIIRAWALTGLLQGIIINNPIIFEGLKMLNFYGPGGGKMVLKLP